MGEGNDPEHAPSATPASEDYQQPPVDANEDEPRLKYSRLGSSVPEILERDSATCLCVSDKLLALGTRCGRVFVLDYDGNEVRGVDVARFPDQQFSSSAQITAT